jgi:hypothetical protein
MLFFRFNALRLYRTSQSILGASDVRPEGWEEALASKDHQTQSWEYQKANFSFKGQIQLNNIQNTPAITDASASV